MQADIPLRGLEQLGNLGLAQPHRLVAGAKLDAGAVFGGVGDDFAVSQFTARRRSL
jgi:hypothetical protein